MASLMGVMLDSLENDAQTLMKCTSEVDRHADFLADTPDFVVDMPSFRTAAEARLEDAEKKLQHALASVRKARAVLRPAVNLRAVS